MRAMKLNIDIYKGVNRAIYRLNNQHRWTSMVTENKYNELAKQALNSMVSYIVASYCEEDGMEIHWERFPRIALYRAFNKAYVSYDTPEKFLAEICRIGSIDKREFDKATRTIIGERTNTEFARFISNDCDTLEYRIFRAGTKIATWLELKEQAVWVRNEKEISDHMDDVMASLEEFMYLPGVKDLLVERSNVFMACRRISRLRNANRWAAFPYIVDCNVLGHLFDTAVFAYFIGLEKFNYDEKLAAKMYFMGIFHDIAEAWTTDIPSDIKDRIPGFREATEYFEDWMLETYLYKVIPDFLELKIKDVMFEDRANLPYKKLMKGADYLSADSECWRQYVAGSRESYFLTSAVQGFDKQLYDGRKAELPPIARELHDTILAYCKDVVDKLKPNCSTTDASL